MAVKKKNDNAHNFRPDSDIIPRILRQRSLEWTNRTAMRFKEFGLWKSITWGEYGERARWVGLGLRELGLNKGDKAAIISEDNPEWLYADLGIQSVGGATVGIYTTDSPEQVEYVVGHSESKFYIAEDEEQLDKILKVRERVPMLKKIFVIDMEGLRHFQDPMVTSFDELLDLGRRIDEAQPKLFEELLKLPVLDDVAFLVYTSGTTGRPKGAMITHRNIMAVMRMHHTFHPAYPDDEIVTYLPLCHILERDYSAINMIYNGVICNFAEEMDTVPQDIREVSPTIFIAVPRIWEKFYSAVILKLKDSTWLEQKAFHYAIIIGKQRAVYLLKGSPPPFLTEILYWFVNWAVLRNVKTFLGLSRTRWCGTGAAPISPEIIKFFYAIGIRMREGYGMTETAGAISVHLPGQVKPGTVGVPYPGVDVRIDDNGEILVRGENIFKGYFKDDELTRQTIVDGWLHTGDVGAINEEGHVIIRDRLKDIIITSGGKNITPSEIENELKFCPYITDAVVIGDGRKYLTALIMIDEENVMKYAQEHRVPFTTYASLTKADEIQKLIDHEVQQVNKKFAQVETIKYFRLIDIKLTADDDEITPTMKLKRKFISRKYESLIESMY